MRKLMLKVALLGDAAVGKTSLRRRFMGKSFTTQHLMTIGADFSTTSFSIGDNNITYQIWDIAGDQSFSRLRSQFYQGVKGALCVFDITREQTYQNLPKWISELWQNNGKGEVPVVLLGNKSDLRNEDSVNVERAKDYATQIEEKMSKPINITYLDTSAKTGLNVEEAFRTLGKEIIRITEL